MKELIVEYSEDLRENKIIGKIYSRLRNNDFHPAYVKTTYIVKLGLTEASFCFMGKEDELPENQKLEEILNELNLNDFSIEQS